MHTLATADALSYAQLDTAELRRRFLIDTLFAPGEVRLIRTDVDRAVVGSIVPLDAPLILAPPAELRGGTFCERRELGIINLGQGGGLVQSGSGSHRLEKLDMLYLGRGSAPASFTSLDAQTPAQFYLLSYPAHAEHPTTLVRSSEARRLELGSVATANRRTLRQYIYPGAVASCQLVMGFTELHEGSVWNTFPPHTHDRRTEIYCYFDLPSQGMVLHLMGEPERTRHLVVREKQVAVSPSWSIHSGVGSGAYRFVWGMGGENQTFDDMDAVPIARLA
jgi:4-deoxy-L-threo-5-hexosulose-uronate ketol-isomerase